MSNIYTCIYIFFCLYRVRNSHNLIYDDSFTIEYIPLYKDMSARDLLQRRATTFAGDTIWENSSLVKAALSGSLAIMDGINTLSLER